MSGHAEVTGLSRIQAREYRAANLASNQQCTATQAVYTAAQKAQHECKGHNGSQVSIFLFVWVFLLPKGSCFATFYTFDLFDFA